MARKSSFFLILGPPLDESNQYLPILGKLCEMVRNTKFKEKLVQAESYDKFIKLLMKG